MILGYLVNSTERSICCIWLLLTFICVEVTVAQSGLTLYNPMDYTGQNTGVGSRSLLQRIFPTQGWSPELHTDSQPAEPPVKK